MDQPGYGVNGPQQNRGPQLVCAWHHDRPTGVTCQRCGRPVCGQCQTQAAVGVHCPACMREGQAQQRAVRTPLGGTAANSNPMLVTWTLIGINVGVYALMWLLQLVNINATYWLGLAPVVAFDEPWRIVTSGFAHSMSNPAHLLLNMYTLWIFGRMLEGGLGRARFLILYFASMLGGSIGVILLSPAYTLTVGASGAIFGLFGAVLAIALWGPRQHRSNLTTIVVLIGINVVFGFIVPGISWQGHLGGLITGTAVMAVILFLRKRAVRNGRRG
ncbi:rhomboid family intramembrane serine protease [Kocuria coralli]|uniref:Rhomboid family intramembrane serine protease n=1 Tax=Kocuria coralli TaxID=1461025 RepID=A0A5J5KU03_9MICC|nr:rhomboid family intramembrane serine protease [Kocuria coralli]KAA9392992.1 rhomboid family intramembrane serine protease [Kocuria coralli]